MGSAVLTGATGATCRWTFICNLLWQVGAGHISHDLHNIARSKLNMFSACTGTSMYAAKVGEWCCWGVILAKECAFISNSKQNDCWLHVQV